MNRTDRGEKDCNNETKGVVPGARVLKVVMEQKEACMACGSQYPEQGVCWSEDSRTSLGQLRSKDTGRAEGRVKRHSEMWMGDRSTDLKVVKELGSLKDCGSG